MSDWVKVVSIITVGIVAILSFVLLPESTALHDKLAWGLLVLVGVYTAGAGIKFGIDAIKRSNG